MPRRLNIYYTIQSDDVGSAFLYAFHGVWIVSSFMGQILPGDVGKRVYLCSSVAGPRMLAVENDEQFKRRLEREKQQNER